MTYPGMHQSVCPHIGRPGLHVPQLYAWGLWCHNWQFRNNRHWCRAAVRYTWRASV